MMRTLFLFCFFVLLGLGACQDSADLRRSVFIVDSQAPGLPQYSEWGYNTFGAYYNREVIVSNDYLVPLRVIQESNSTVFQFQGHRGNSHWGGSEFSISVTIPDFTPQTYADLVSLDKTTIDLEDRAYVVSIIDAGSTQEIEVLNGTLEFKRAQYLFVDKEPTEVILSGVFEFQAIINGQPVSISEGRFDIGVGSYNFFVYN